VASDAIWMHLKTSLFGHFEHFEEVKIQVVGAKTAAQKYSKWDIFVSILHDAANVTVEGV